MKSALLSNIHFRKTVLFIIDTAAVAAAYILAFWLRLDENDFPLYWPVIEKSLPWLLIIRAICGLAIRQYTWAFRLASLSEAVALAAATAAGTIIFVLATWLSEANIPRTVYFIEFALALMAFGFVRFFPRYCIQVTAMRNNERRGANGEDLLRTLIYGAGHTGELILRDLMRTRAYPYQIVGFIDDDPIKRNTSIHGYRVFGSADELPDLIRKHRIEKILVAIPGIEGHRMRRIVDICANHHIRFKTVPSYANILAGEGKPITLKDVQPEDLLDRQPVSFNHSRMAEFFSGKCVMVTGAAGSIGSEICRQVAAQGAKRLIALDVNENDLYFLNLELQEMETPLDVRIEIASIRDRDALESLFARYRPEIVFHAAAHKHVPLMEACPAEALKNNVLGTLNLASCAVEHKAETFVLISTDKAVRPTSVMGASKRLAEFVIQEMNKKNGTRFMAVRFGNVLGSNGSLVQILQKQIAKGGPVTVTHPKITRFFMTIPEAVGLVLVAAVQQEGDLCVLDMGEPLSIDRLAREMISLSGLIPDKDIPVIYTGLRPGEKMFEELFTESEEQKSSTHPRIRLATYLLQSPPLDTIVTGTEEALRKNTRAAIYQAIGELVPDFQPEENAAQPPEPNAGTG